MASPASLIADRSADTLRVRRSRGWRFSAFLDIQLSNSTGRRTPTRLADGHADSHDEFRTARCSSSCKSLRRQVKIFVTDKVASAGGARICGNGVVFRPAAPMQPRGERNRFALAIKPARSRMGFAFCGAGGKRRLRRFGGAIALSCIDRKRSEMFYCP